VIDELLAAYIHRIDIHGTTGEHDAGCRIEHGRRHRDHVEVRELADFERTELVSNAHHLGAAQRMQAQDLDRLHDRRILVFCSQHIQADAHVLERIGDVGARLAVDPHADLHA
jgi:hypothetical protein